MSALSNCVTWGMVFHAWLRCSAVLRRMPDMALRSTSPHFEKSGSAGPLPAGRDAAAAWPPLPKLFITRFANSLTSSCVMRPPGPVPVTWLTSTPISRARRRTEGAAGAAVTTDAMVGVAAVAAGAAGRPAAISTPVGRSAGAADAAGASGAGAGAGTLALVAPVAPFSITRTIWPGFSLSPALTFTSFTVPATSDGTSIVALSVSSSTMGWSTLMVSPTLTSTLRTSPWATPSPRFGRMKSATFSSPPGSTSRRRCRGP